MSKRTDDPAQLDLFNPLLARKVVGFYSAAPGSGKSTAAMAARRLMEPAEIVPFAAGVRYAAYHFLVHAANLDPDEATLYLYDNSLKNETIPGTYCSPRELLVHMGTKLGRELVDPDLWVKAWRREVELLDLASTVPGVGTNVIVDDVRFPNEAEEIRRMGGVVIEIARPGVVVDAASAPSEGLLGPDHVDVIVLNEGSLEDLSLNVEVALRNLEVIY